MPGHVGAAAGRDAGVGRWGRPPSNRSKGRQTTKHTPIIQNTSL